MLTIIYIWKCYYCFHKIKILPYFHFITYSMKNKYNYLITIYSQNDDMFIIINLFIFLILNIIIYNLDENKMGKIKLINLLICLIFFLNELNYNYVFIFFNYLFSQNIFIPNFYIRKLKSWQIDFFVYFIFIICIFIISRNR